MTTTRPRRSLALACGITSSALTVVGLGTTPSHAEQTTPWCGSPAAATTSAPATVTAAARPVATRYTSQRAMLKATHPTVRGKHATKPVKPTANGYATYEKPYAADSLWNSQPIRPVLGTWQIPDTATKWWATVGNGNYGIDVQQGVRTDKAQVIVPLAGEKGVWDATSEQLLPSVTLPHFPAGTMPPAGTDGSVAIEDAATGVIYSFWQLRHDVATNTWCAKQISESHVDGQGWGDPSAQHLGASAAGQSQLAGLIRKEEYAQTADPMYHHALNATLDSTGLLDGITYQDANGNTQHTVAYQFPATDGDGWGGQNTGRIPEGALLMLPKDYPVDKLPSRELRKVARTLQVYGAYVVDRNYGVPLSIGAANGYDYELGDQPYDDPNLDDAGDWAKYEASGVGQAMDDVRRHVRMVVATDGFRTAAGTVIRPRPGWDVNLINIKNSDKQPWVPDAANPTAKAVFDPITQRLSIADRGVTLTRTGDFQEVTWAMLHPGERVRLTVTSKGGAALRLMVKCDGATAADTGWVGNGGHAVIQWPSCLGAVPVTMVDSGRGNSWVQADLRRI